MSQCCLQLPDRTLAYRLKRSKRRTIGLAISREGLTVTLPLRLPEHEAERAIRQKLGWILDKLARQAEQPVSAGFAAGCSVLWLGEPKCLRMGARTRLDGADLHVAAADRHEEIAQAITRFFQRTARTYFAERVAVWSQRMGLVPERLSLSSARGRWGSCSSSGALRLNWRLMQAPPAVIDYVVIHELAHLAELNHSPRFWAIVEQHCPAWVSHRDWLKHHGNLLMGW